MEPNFHNICLKPHQQMMYGTPLEYNLQRYFYPAIAIFGILGNFLNLTVLLNRSMRSRANTFLSVLAFADIIFLSLLFPNILANYELFTFSYLFRYLYFHTKVHLLSLANWCSAVAIWCVIAVCADRLVGIRSPLYARAKWRWWKLPAVIATILLVTGAATFYQHFEYFCLVRSYCHGTQLYSRCLPVNADTWWGNRKNPFSERFQQMISVSVLIYIFLMIIFPIGLLVVLNVMLLVVLRKRQKRLNMNQEKNENARRSHEAQLQKTEHRVTLTVSFIVTMFTLTNGPSALIHIIRSTNNLPQEQLYDITMICSTLVICGKASNFILFCLGSKHFRMRLMKLTQKKMNKKIDHIRALQTNLFGLFTIVQFVRNRTANRNSTVIDAEDSFAGSLIPNAVSRAFVARRQSAPNAHKSSSSTNIQILPKTSSTVDHYKPLINGKRDSLTP